MESTAFLPLTQHFAALDDPRVERTKLHRLVDIVAIALCAVIAGAESWDDIALFGQTKADWLGQFLALPNGIPSHDTFNRVFAALVCRAGSRAVSRGVSVLDPGHCGGRADAGDCGGRQDRARVA
jgi:hypothetical protein